MDAPSPSETCVPRFVGEPWEVCVPLSTLRMWETWTLPPEQYGHVALEGLAVAWFALGMVSALLAASAVQVRKCWRERG